MILPPALSVLERFPQFVTYFLTPSLRRAGKMDKLPCNPLSGLICDAHDPANWTDYTTAFLHAPRIDQGYGSGVGFVISENDPFWFLDADDCIDEAGALNENAAWLDVALRGAARETSQSGRGLHWLGCGAVPPHSSRNIRAGLEFYTEGRFVAFGRQDWTGDIWTDHSGALATFVPHYFPPPSLADFPEWTTEPVAGWTPLSDDEIIARALKTQPGAWEAFGAGVSFKELWEADEDALARAFPDNERPYNASSADQALAGRLAFWTGKNCEHIERLMRRSALARAKWDDRPDWLKETIVKGCRFTKNVYNGGTKGVEEAQRAAAAISNGWDGKPDKGDHLCIEAFIAATGFSLRYDEFANRIRTADGRIVDDSLRNEIFFTIRSFSNLRFPFDLVTRTIDHLAMRAPFHPVREYFDAQESRWDGVPRIETWIRDYCGADDTPFNRAAAGLFLRAAVRRVRDPGHKFDELLVLEGAQGLGKSSAFRALCPDPAWFTDDFNLAMTSKEVLEITPGKLIVEMPELSKLNNKEIEHVKAMLSRQSDRARLAYGRDTVEIGRQWVGAGTTNAERWMRDPTGNRRFWPITVSSVNIDGLAAVRDQLWAEAAIIDKQQSSVRLPAHLWAEAAEAQEERMLIDPMYEALAAVLGERVGRISSDTVWQILAINSMPERQRAMSSRSDAMRRLGWTYGRRRDGSGGRPGYFVRGNTVQQTIELELAEDRKSLRAAAVRVV